jgi:D-alanyl-D-alanine carboxypeptidase
LSRCIKTGYISASGFNIITSLHRDNRYLIAVVFGGSSAGSRDDRVRELIHDHFAEASVQHTAPLVADAGTKPSAQTYAVASAAVTVTSSKPDTKAKPETKSTPAYALASATGVPFTLLSKSDPKAAAKAEAKSGQTYALASAESVPITLSSKSDPSATTTVQVPRWGATNSVPAARYAPAVGSEDPIHPVPVKTVLVKAGGAVQTASIAPLQLPVPAETPAPAVSATPAPAKTAVLPFPPPGTRPGAIGGLPSRITTTGSIADSMPAPIAAPTPPSGAASSAPAPSAPAPSAPAPVTPTPTHSAAAAAAQQVHAGWIIQVGAFPAEGEAKQRLSTVQSKAARFLASADAFTESVSKGESVLYRARFAGLGKEQAEAACNYLKRNDVDCMTIRN